MISVVIPAWDVADALPEQLEALAGQTYEGTWEVVLADNGSTDSTVGVALDKEQALPELRIVNADERTRINYVRNVGARAARGDVILFCDADHVVTPRWVEAMGRGLEEFDAVGGPLDVATLNKGLDTAVVRHEPPQDGFELALGVLPRPVGCNSGVRAAVYDDLGGFDETYAGGGDETEFFWRLQLAGYDLGFAPEAVVRYRYRRTAKSTLKQIFGMSRAKPRLYRQFRHSSAPPRGARATAARWVGLLRRVHYLADPRKRRLEWLATAARRLGHLVGSIRYRVMYL